MRSRLRGGGPIGHTRQMHFWLSSPDADFLTELASSQERSVGSLLRELVRKHRKQVQERREANYQGIVVSEGDARRNGWPRP